MVVEENSDRQKKINNNFEFIMTQPSIKLNLAQFCMSFIDHKNICVRYKYIDNIESISYSHSI